MRSVSSVGIGLIAVYLLLLVALFGCQRQMMYMPMGSAPDPAAVGLPDAELVAAQTEDGLQLTSWYLPPTEPGLPTIVVFQGNAGNISHRAFMARTLADAGYGVFLTGYRGYGGNPGSPTETGLFRDGRAVLDTLAGRDVEGEDIVLFGESLGSGVAVRMAAERPVGAVVLIAPFTSAVDVAARHYPIFPVRLLMKDRFDNIDHIADIDAPLLIIQGDNDTIIDPAQGRRLYDAAREPKTIVTIPGAGHNDIYDRGALEEVLSFLEDF
jgi:uncharacterized protein